LWRLAYIKLTSPIGLPRHGTVPVNGAPQTTVYIQNEDCGFSKTVDTPWPAGTPYGGNWTLYIGNFDGDVDEVRISSVDRGALP
jgi:hypothetical protein